MTQRRRITIEASEEDVEAVREMWDALDDTRANDAIAERLESLASRIEAALREGESEEQP